MTLRIDANDLPAAVVARLEQGEPAEVERDGVTIARVQPCAHRPKARDLWSALADLPPLDADFERDVAQLELIVKPQPYAWE